MTITDLKWHPLYGTNYILREKIIESLTQTVKYLISKGYHILLIPQIFGNNSEKPLFKIISRIDKKKIIILPGNVDAYAQQIIISKLYCIIGMRYHSMIFAGKENIPSISISYEHKTLGFMEMLDRSDLIINVENISSDKIINKFMYLEDNYDKIKEEIKLKIPKLKYLSKKTTEIIIEKLKNLKGSFINE